jgi:hypothetical protein
MQTYIVFLAVIAIALASDGIVIKSTYKPKRCDEGPLAANGDAVALNYFGAFSSGIMGISFITPWS